MGAPRVRWAHDLCQTTFLPFLPSRPPLPARWGTVWTPTSESSGWRRKWWPCKRCCFLWLTLYGTGASGPAELQLDAPILSKVWGGCSSTGSSLVGIGEGGGREKGESGGPVRQSRQWSGNGRGGRCYTYPPPKHVAGLHLFSSPGWAPTWACPTSWPQYFITVYHQPSSLALGLLRK